MRGLLLALLVGAASGRHASTSADVERILDSIDHDVKALTAEPELALHPITGGLERAKWVEVKEDAWTCQSSPALASGAKCQDYWQFHVMQTDPHTGGGTVAKRCHTYWYCEKVAMRCRNKDVSHDPHEHQVCDDKSHHFGSSAETCGGGEEDKLIQEVARPLVWTKFWEIVHGQRRHGAHPPAFEPAALRFAGRAGHG